MGKLELIIGGARSGKSAFALKRAEEVEGAKLYLATATALDTEMAERIEAHRNERAAMPGWTTVEEPLDPARVIAEESGASLILLDCLTLWLTNLIGEGRTDSEIYPEIERLGEAVAASGALVIAVSNELGLGIVPENKLARRFRDLSGRANQMMAGASESVYFMVAGQPLKVK